MMGVQTQVTDSVGLYRFVSVPPGEYKLVFELPGFATVNREGMRLTASFTATINTQMGVAALTESVQVTGDSPVVDTQSTAINTTFDKETLANLPSARDYWADSVRGAGRQAAAHRRRRQRRRHADDLLRLRHDRPEPADGRRASTRPRAPARSATTSTTDRSRRSRSAAARRAPRARCLACYTVLISKSGGNRYSGSFYGDYESKDWQSYNIDAAQIAAGVTGGGGLEPRDINRLDQLPRSERRHRRLPEEGQDLVVRVGPQPRLGGPLHELSGRSRTRRSCATSRRKVTYQLSQNNKLIGYYQPSTKVQTNRLDRQLLGGTAAIHLTDDASFRQDYSPLLWKAEWNSVLSPSTFFEVRTGQFGYDWPDTPNGTGASYEDLNTSIVSGRARARQLNIQRTQVLGSLSYFKNDCWRATTTSRSAASGSARRSTPQRFAGSYNDVLHVLRSGVPSEVLLFEPAKSENGLYTLGLYAQDTWQAQQPAHR